MQDPTLKEYRKLLTLEDRADLVPITFADYDFVIALIVLTIPKNPSIPFEIA